jgi:molybdate transport system ATP-binding protein
VIELSVSLPLSRFRLEVTAALPADTVALLGPSGSGKTSLLETIAGLRPKATGRVLIRGERVMDTVAGLRLPPEKRRIGYVPQDACLFPHLDVRDNVRFGMRSRNGGSRLFDEAVGILEIAPLLDRFPSTLSGGEKQRVALARAIATEPRLLLLDEPLAAVDFALRGRILPYLLHVRESMGIPFLYVTHNAGEARAVAEAALVLRRGAVAFAGTPDDAIEVMSADEDPEARFDNILAGIREASGTGGELGVLRVGESRFAVPAEKDVAAGTRAVYSVAPEDVLVSTRPLEGISARNVHAGHVISVGTAGADAWIGISAAGLEWTARLTRTASEVLGLATGLDVWIAVKTQAFKRLR